MSTPAKPTAIGNASAGAPPFKPDIPRRPVEGPPAATPRRPATPIGDAPSPAGEGRRLIVGRDISLSGEIASCDLLLVEGTVEARLRHARFMEITDIGLFKGGATVDDADIAGRFEGELVVRGRLRVKTTGRVGGVIKYAELEVERGGQITGELQVIDAGGSDSLPEPTHGDDSPTLIA
jgi:cytoskeletal protein CcmA (bactofilin family)